MLLCSKMKQSEHHLVGDGFRVALRQCNGEETFDSHRAASMFSLALESFGRENKKFLIDIDSESPTSVIMAQ